MKVLVLGMPRTGTQSIAEALIQLGISPIYHMREVGQNNHQAAWAEAMDAKFEGKGKPYGREEFDKILGDFEGLADYPAVIFPAELIEAYPEAKIILTLRSDEDKWFDSMMATLIHGHTHAPKPNPSPMAPVSSRYHRFCWNDDFPTHGREAYRKQNAVVREAARGREFLEYETGSGWAPLCEFLGLPIPDVPYPRSDDWAVYKKEVQAQEELKKKQDHEAKE
ncbi:hypothetical protein PFICI_03812 [Pestalotiopsis fici W106-1]|uniref:NAD dependent epimerase/dehydratase n=1 Tax=Pestalotiopsis fici (strain W106-1 / CGMCC3.15140) TaxID=1229662 RepID=W3XK04_PESFW|nr:uncharacterized protein PFICI_03812 [Pestalotiopsis fici W106-1]ETS85787.1 hypothetical protein PFICI_03812 [Pestalotiopsis fici W106-1]